MNSIVRRPIFSSAPSNTRWTYELFQEQTYRGTIDAECYIFERNSDTKNRRPCRHSRLVHRVSENRFTLSMFGSTRNIKRRFTTKVTKHCRQWKIKFTCRNSRSSISSRWWHFRRKYVVNISPTSPMFGFCSNNERIRYYTCIKESYVFPFC